MTRIAGTLMLVASTVAPTLTQADIDHTVHEILTYQQAEREHTWGHALEANEANRQAQVRASRARVTVSPSATSTGSPTRTEPTTTSSSTGTLGPSILTRIRGCESGTGPTSPGSYTAENRTSSASGAYQFLGSTWATVTGLAPPASAYSSSVQDQAARTLYESSGTAPWASSRGCWG